MPGVVVEIAWAEVELVQQKVAHAYRTVVGNPSRTPSPKCRCCIRPLSEARRS